jgi:hypothetical protein
MLTQSVLSTAQAIAHITVQSVRQLNTHNVKATFGWLLLFERTSAFTMIALLFAMAL